MDCFNTFFKFPNHFKTEMKHCMFTWEDSYYEKFMIQVFQYLTPIRYEANEIIYAELDDCDQVLFILSGKYEMGYTINTFKKMKLRLPKFNEKRSSSKLANSALFSIIGSFEVSYNRRCGYVYQCYSDMDCMCIT